MEGYKTQLVTAVTAILTAATAFGIDLTEEQRAAVLGIVSFVVWPTVMLIMRAVTKGPMKNPVTGNSIGSKAQTPWWVVVLLLPLLFLGGCTTLGYDDIQIDDTKDAILVANAEVRGANFLLQDLLRTDSISKADAQRAKDSLDDAHDVLNEALAAVELHGDLFTAEDKLDAAIRALDVALRLLAPHAAPDLEEAA